MTESSSKGYKKTNAEQKQGAKNQIRRWKLWSEKRLLPHFHIPSGHDAANIFVSYKFIMWIIVWLYY
jgi:hypothetical protein